MNDCIFCKIVKGELPSRKVYEDDDILAFHDIYPRADTHIVFIPKSHISSADHIDEGNVGVVAKIFATIPGVMKELEITNGYRVVTNVGEDGGQTVGHLHFHAIGGNKLKADFC